MKMRIVYPVVLLIVLHVMSWQTFAQLTFSGQVRVRGEYRDGQGSPSVKDTVPAAFISQRTRIIAGYSAYRVKVWATVQDVRVWGQDASSVNRVTADANDGLMLHEAWAEISLVDTGKVVRDFYLRLGRQELIYDDSRLLGNLDWLQQARRHDAALLKFEHRGWTANLGAAYNQNAERKSGTVYNGVPTGYAAGTNGIGALYKAMQFVYVARKLKTGKVSTLFFKDDFSKFHFAAADIDKKNPIYEGGAWSRYTAGVFAQFKPVAPIQLTLNTVYQGGHYREGTRLDEYLLSAYAQYTPATRVGVGAGIDVTSGNAGADPARKFQRFDPLYGTPHKFWGTMDYFYAADGFGANGLTDFYIKTRYTPLTALTVNVDAHRFVLPHAVNNTAGDMLQRELGTELDITCQYTLTPAIAVEGGYSALFATPTLASAAVKNIPRADTFAQWAYVMIAIKPEPVKK